MTVLFIWYEVKYFLFQNTPTQPDGKLSTVENIFQRTYFIVYDARKKYSEL